MIRPLVSFLKRRIFIPVNKDCLVLDIGSGDKPHWRSDILLDKYISDDFGSQRSGSKKTLIYRPIFNADAEDVPFADKVFDFVICSHLLEHVPNPAKVMQEMMRVGKAGYIELPYEGSQKISDFPTHLWYCRKENERIIFTAKPEAIFDQEIDNFVRKTRLKKKFDDCIMSINWKDKIDYQVIGKPNMGILLRENTVSHNRFVFFMRNLLNSLSSLLFFWKRRRTSIVANDILKPEFYMVQGEILKKRLYDIQNK